MSTKHTIKSAAGDVAEKAKSAAKEAAQSVKEEAHAQAVGAKDNVAGEVKSVASALRTASNEMRDGSPQERAMGQIAETLADVSDSIRDQDLGEMATTAISFARRNPLVFLGGAALLGFTAARFAKSSGDNAPDTYEDHARTASYGSHQSRATPGAPVPPYAGERT